MDGGTGVGKGQTCHQFNKKITAYCYGYKSMIVAALVAVFS